MTGLSRRTACMAILLVAAVTMPFAVLAADSFSEDFSAAILPGNMEKTGDGPVPTFNGSNVVFTGSSPVGPPDPMIRSYLRTLQDGYNTADFVMEITTTIPPEASLGNHQAAIAFFGLGVGTNLNFGSPDQGPVIFAAIQPDDFSPGFYGISRNAAGSGVNESDVACGGDGTHRFRFQWNSATETAVLSIDEDYVGGPFVADCTLPPIAGGALGLDVTNSRIFFGGDNTMSFDDLTVRATVAPTFVSQTITGNADGAEGVFAADVDGDGDLDAFSASFEDSTVAWHENVLGDGSAWVAHTISASASAASSVHGDDVDGDGDMDLLVSSRLSNRIDWFENSAGDGSAWTQRNISTTAVAALWVFSVDLDVDGDVDVLSASEGDGEFSWFENTAGDGSAWTERVIATGVFPQQIHVADIDGDGDLDALTAAEGASMVAWQENTAGDGTAWTQHVIESSVDDWIRSVYGSDVDGDGDVDVLSASVTQSRITLHENTAGDGSAWTPRVISSSAFAAESVIALDIDADGDMDVASASSADDKIAWYANLDGEGTLWAPHVVTTAADAALDVVAADVDGDGDVDFLSASELDDKIAWYENRTIHGRAVFPVSSTIRSVGSGDREAQVADVDRDGDLDVVAVAGGSVEWYANTAGDGSAWSTTTIEASAGVSGRGLAVADLDGDGDLDVAWITDFGTPPMQWAENTAGDGSAWTTATVFAGPAPEGQSIKAVDVDGDGDLDLFTTETSGNIAWHENTAGDGSSWTQHVLQQHTFNWDSEPADIDGDGDLDVFNTRGFWYENTSGDGSIFMNRASFSSLGGNIYRMEAADIDGDGDFDMAMNSVSLNTIEWYENVNGDGSSWSTRTITTEATGVEDMRAVDIDGDGDVDIASANNISNGNILFFENMLGDGTVWSKQTVGGLSGLARHTTSGDLDGDGRLDLVSVQSAVANTVTWHRNLGGQYGITASDVGVGAVPEGQETAVLALEITVAGRSGDSTGLLENLDVLFETAGGGAPLTSAQANALIETLRIYRDSNESGEFEPDSDLPMPPAVTDLSLTAGVQEVRLGSDDPGVVLAAPVTYFVVVEMTADASSQSPSSFRIGHLPTQGDQVLDGGSGRVLRRQYSTGLKSQDLSAVRTISVNAMNDGSDFNQGDGVCETANGNGICTLRAAIREADATAADEWITVPPGTYVLTGNGLNDPDFGDLDIANPLGGLTIVGAGPGQTVISSGLDFDRVLFINGANVRLEGLTIRNGDPGEVQGGGGILISGSANVELDNCEITANQSQNGGGIRTESGSTLNMTNSVLSGNSVSNGFGGGLRNDGVVTMDGCTVHGNDAATGGGGIADFWELTVTNSTISGNSTSGSGGGIRVFNVDGDPQLTLDSVTLVENSAVDFFGGLEVNAALQVLVRNTILADNTGPSANDCAGTIDSEGHNLIEDTTGCTITGDTTGNILGLDPQLTPLGNHGGSTLTHETLPGSPVIDAGSCGSLTVDQRGVPRPVDIPGESNADDGCDIGAFEAELGPTQDIVAVPVRWCGVRGAPSIEDPSEVLEDSANDVMRRRHERASQKIFVSQAGIQFRSAGNENVPNYPLLEDPSCVENASTLFACDAGVRGDVLLDLDEGNTDEFKQLVASCREAWNVADDDLQGVTALHIRRFVDPAGNELDILGVGGRAGFGQESEQAVGARLMVIDNVFRMDVPGNPSNPLPNPFDDIDRLLGHELGHALSLNHGDGIDNDNDGFVDNDDDAAVGLPTFDGTNLMQYRAGSDLTAEQAFRMRAHVAATIPDVDVQPISDVVPGAADLSEEHRKVLQFGYDALTNVPITDIDAYASATDLEFENRKVLQFENRRVLQFENRKVLQFENARINQFGVDSLPGANTRIHASTADLPWPAAIRPKTKYFFYLDLDRDDSTGAFPPDKENPSDPGRNFPGSNNLEGLPDVSVEFGVDFIMQVTLTASCPGQVCVSQSEVKGFDFNDAPGVLEYEEVYSASSPKIVANSVATYVDNGGQVVEFDEIPTGITVQPEIPDALLLAAGWDPSTVTPIRMEVLSTIDCSGNVLNDDSSSAPADCQCTDCASCPDYPGCVGMVGTPATLAETEILTDCKQGELNFQPPVLPSCSAAPRVAAEDATVTLHITDLPLPDPPATPVDIEVSFGSTVLAPINAVLDANGGVSLAGIQLPVGQTGDLSISAGIDGSAERAECVVNVTPNPPCLDSDGDEICDSVDTDDDNDGVADGSDSAPTNPLVCQDLDGDTCDDCVNGPADPSNDGPDFDGDGICDLTDPDDDNDGIDDTIDGDPFNSASCGDVDGDNCEDCSVVATPDPSNDGPDNDDDGLCDLGDPDDDNDGTFDVVDCAVNDPSVWSIPTDVPATLAMAHVQATGVTTLSWDEPANVGNPIAAYDTLREGVRNDVCQDAVGLPLPADIAGTTVGWGQESSALDCVESIQAPGIWYRVHGTGNTMTASTCNEGTDYDTILNVYCADCAAPTCITANDDQTGGFDPSCDSTGIGVNRASTVSWCSELGAAYYVLVQGFGGFTGTFQLTVDDDAVTCGGAVPCAAGFPGTCEDSFSIPSPDGLIVGGPTTGSPDPNPPAFGCVVPLDPGPAVWVSAIGNGEIMEASTCYGSTDFDTKLHVYCDSCDRLLCLAGNDDDPAGNDPACELGPGEFWKSTVTWCSEPGATYRILTSGFGGASGTAVVGVTHTGIPCQSGFSCREVDLCLESEGTDRVTTDPQNPQPGELFRYLIRGVTSCGDGSLGPQSSGAPRPSPGTCL